MESIISTNSRVAVPFISVKIGDYTFGLYNKTKSNIEINGKYYASMQTTYPNYMQSLTVNKVNGAVNTYTLVMKYPITADSDPNLIDKILSTVSTSRYISFTYGDCASPTFMYKNEEALITQVTSNIDVANACITYNITAVSSAWTLKAGNYSFPAYSDKKPSDVIKELLFNKSYGLQDIFYGMNNRKEVERLGLIISDDAVVPLEAQSSITVLDYLIYLVSCMTSINDVNDSLNKTSKYVLTVHDDTSNTLSGPYFKITQVLTAAVKNSSLDYYTIDIGYVNKDIVTNFSIDNDESYAILYDYAQGLTHTEYVYHIGDDGELVKQFSPAIANSRTQLKTTTATKAWWSQVTQFPIKATLTIKGLLRAAVLMSYIKVNVYFYGRKHNASGTYMITKQVDNISTSGYFTTLSLVRIAGEN